MRLIDHDNKKTWILFGISLVIALTSFAFLPNSIPTHFNGSGVADGYSNKIAIFLFPLIQIVIILLSGSKPIKYYLTHSKTFFTDTQYSWIIAGLAFVLLLLELVTIYFCFS